MEWPIIKNEWLEEYAVFKQPKKGKCAESQFKNGYHRIGYMPEFCPNDGGLKGASAYQVCLDCGKRFKREIFLV